MVYDINDMRDIFRNHVLEALDKAACETFNPPRNDAGATDADLPRLFDAIDKQLFVLAGRYNAILVDPVKA